MGTNSRAIGARAEGAVAEELERKGFTIIDRNYCNRIGEIDIIAEKDGLLAFVEVKYRRNDNYGTPAGAVTYRKQCRLIKIAEMYIAERELYDLWVRFDVAEVRGVEMNINIIEGAFDLNSSNRWENFYG